MLELSKISLYKCRLQNVEMLTMPEGQNCSLYCCWVVHKWVLYNRLFRGHSESKCRLDVHQVLNFFCRKEVIDCLKFIKTVP